MFAKALTKKDIQQLYQGADGYFSDYLPFKEFNNDHQCLLLQDGKSVGFMAELSMIDVEGIGPERLDAYAGGLQKVLNAVPQDRGEPWIMQMYIQNEPVQALIPQIQQAVDPRIKGNAHSRFFIQVLNDHLRQASKKQGLFHDGMADINWRTQLRKVRICVYRTFDAISYFKGKKGEQSPVAKITNLRKGMDSALRTLGISMQIMNDAAIESWLVPWFAPNPREYADGYELVGHLNTSEEKPFSYDLARRVLVAPPETDERGFSFMGQRQQYISCQPLQSEPKAGRVTADLLDATGQVTCLWDKMPHGSVFIATIVFDNQNDVRGIIQQTADGKPGFSSEQQRKHEQAIVASKMLSEGERLYSLSVGAILKAESITELDEQIIKSLATLRSMGLEPIDPQYDLLHQDMFIRSLPMAYDPAFEKSVARRSSWNYSSTIAKILPLYGRPTGTGNPGVLFYNRAGEPFLIDPIKDRSRVAHSLIFGPTGAGKSVFLNYDILYKMALYKCRLFVIEKGDSMRWTAEYLRDKGYVINRIKYSKSTVKPIPVFGTFRKAYEEIISLRKLSDGDAHLIDDLDKSEEVNAEDEERDYTGEIQQLVFLMISGANENEYQRLLTQENKLIIAQAIEEGIITAVEKNLDYFIPEDIANQLKQIGSAQQDEQRGRVIMALADAMFLWTKGLRGKLFNQRAEPWEEADATFIDMGMLTSDAYKDALAVAVISLMHQITGLGEAHQAEATHTFVYIDEGHVITTNPTIAAPVVFGAKTWRKLWIWLIQATQNLEDYPDSSAKMISMAEWYWLLNLADGEVQDFNRFVKLSDDSNKLITSTVKQKAAFTEGVMVNRDLRHYSLFRVVLPTLPLILAGTEGDEKKAIVDKATELSCTPIEAIYRLADELYQKREAM